MPISRFPNVREYKDGIRIKSQARESRTLRAVIGQMLRTSVGDVGPVGLKT